MTGNASAVAALARFGSAARGEPVYEAGVHLGRLLRTALLADYFVKMPFRQELRRVLNRGKAVNSLKRAIYTGRISPAHAKRPEEMQAVANGLSLLANTVMAWNTMQMQAEVNRWANRRQVIEADIMAKIAPTRLSGINLRGVFRFPVERYAANLMPSLAPPINAAVGCNRSRFGAIKSRWENSLKTQWNQTAPMATPTPVLESKSPLRSWKTNRPRSRPPR
jgi:hypothetical protein